MRYNWLIINRPTTSPPYLYRLWAVFTDYFYILKKMSWSWARRSFIIILVMEYTGPTILSCVGVSVRVHMGVAYMCILWIYVCVGVSLSACLHLFESISLYVCPYLEVLTATYYWAPFSFGTNFCPIGGRLTFKK